MKHSHRLCCGLRWVLLLILLGYTSACGIFRLRHHRWEQQVTRTPEGILEHSLPFTLAGGDDALLLVHGFGDGPGIWQTLAPGLQAEGFTVRAMRLPGWGESPAVKRGIRRADWEAAIVQELETLRTHHRRVGVLAHSLGGCLTALLAAQQALPADGLILYAPMVAVSNARSPVLPARTWHEIGRRIVPGGMLIESLFSDHARVIEPRPRSERDPFVPAGLFIELYSAMDALQAAPRALSIPLRMVLPGEDDVIDLQAARQWLEELTAPAAELYVEEAAGHVLPLEVDPELEAARIRRWFDEKISSNP